MNLYLVPWLSIDIQYRALTEKNRKIILLSFAHQKEFEYVMDFYFAGNPNPIGRENIFNKENQLSTYADGKAEREIIRTEGNKLMIDSGAFTAFNSGKVIRVEDYSDFIKRFTDKFKSHVKDLYFVNLDVINDAKGSNKNLQYLEEKGNSVLPVLTYQAPLADLTRFLDNYDYILFGGLVGKKNEPLKAWLDFCFSRVMKKYKVTGKMPRIHLLGVTKEWALSRYPIYSSDSSSWLQAVKYGNAKHAGIAKLKRYSAGISEYHASLHALKKSIDYYVNLEGHITNLWKSRGVTFNE
jgi:hypothetical protein